MDRLNVSSIVAINRPMVDFTFMVSFSWTMSCLSSRLFRVNFFPTYVPACVVLVYCTRN